MRCRLDSLSTLNIDLGVLFCRWRCADLVLPDSLQLSRLTPPIALVREQPTATALSGSAI